MMESTNVNIWLVRLQDFLTYLEIAHMNQQARVDMASLSRDPYGQKQIPICLGTFSGAKPRS